MIHIFHQIQGFKGVAHGAGANKNKEDFHGIVSQISKKFTNFIMYEIRVGIQSFLIGQKFLKLSNLEFKFDETMS